MKFLSLKEWNRGECAALVPVEAIDVIAAIRNTANAGRLTQRNNDKKEVRGTNAASESSVKFRRWFFAEVMRSMVSDAIRRNNVNPRHFRPLLAKIPNTKPKNTGSFRACISFVVGAVSFAVSVSFSAALSRRAIREWEHEA